MPNFLQRAF
ncbi:hypothetical protein EYZ11_013046 [Aspergillus tanneri]|uniref:Uncharacterized protein n=1 Tax=Aspergillus tanneri TaxID=1220188 RepID=A0A4S3J0U3_9EURO|nr:hypothetical protein EYZ11_013046 [Aspergillus tanneri]